MIGCGVVGWSPFPFITGCGCVASLLGEWVATFSTSVMTVYYTILSGVTEYSTVLYYTILYCIMLYYLQLYYGSIHCTILYHNVQCSF